MADAAMEVLCRAVAGCTNTSCAADATVHVALCCSNIFHGVEGVGGILKARCRLLCYGPPIVSLGLDVFFIAEGLGRHVRTCQVLLELLVTLLLPATVLSLQAMMNPKRGVGCQHLLLALAVAVLAEAPKVWQSLLLSPQVDAHVSTFLAAAFSLCRIWFTMCWRARPVS